MLRRAHPPLPSICVASLLQRVRVLIEAHVVCSIVQSNAHSVAAAVRALSAILTVADERVCVGNR